MKYTIELDPEGYVMGRGELFEKDGYIWVRHLGTDKESNTGMNLQGEPMTDKLIEHIYRDQVWDLLSEED